MSTFCHGVASAQNIDKSGELVDIAGLDITSLPRTGILNYEHKSDAPGQICGKILTAKKIFTAKDCSNQHESYFWSKCQVPFVYITAELLDNYCQSGKDAAGLFRYDHDNKGKKLPILGFSVEGSELPGTRQNKMMIMKSIARKVTLTASPCNSLCVAELMEEQAPQVKNDLDFLFKNEANAITMLKSDQGLKMYEDFLSKKEPDQGIPLKKPNSGIPHGWTPSSTQHPKLGAVVSMSHPEHGTVTVHKNPDNNKFEVKHAGKLAGVMGQKGSFDTNKGAIAHAQKYVHALHGGKVLGRETANVPSSSPITKSIDAGSGNAAPSALSGGAVYAKESLSKPKTDWKKRAKDEYDRWPQREKFEKFMSARMPHLAMGEIQAIGRTISLSKSLEFEKSLDDLVKSEGSSKAPYQKPHFLFSAENPYHPDKNESKMDHKQTLAHLKSKGYNANEVKGHYGSPETSIMVHNISPKQAEHLHGMASKLGQDSSLYSTGKEHEMRFHHGEKAGKSVHGTGTVEHSEKPKDNFTTLPNGKHFTHNLDFNKLTDTKPVHKSEYFGKSLQKTEETAKELDEKTLKQIQIETAEKWADRAAEAYKKAVAEKSIKWLLDADEYFHEAIEHSSLSEDLSTFEKIRAKIMPIRKEAFKLLAPGANS